MSKKNPMNCWEFWDCPTDVKKKCAAFISNSGEECWMVAGTHSKKPTCPKIMNNIMNCWDCDWFKKLNPKF